MSHVAHLAGAVVGTVAGYVSVCVFFFLIHRSHSISFTRAQGIPKYKIGFGRGERLGELGKDRVWAAIFESFFFFFFSLYIGLIP